jgi:pimeloyl-ACP methyl ester carboxylesterase
MQLKSLKKSISFLLVLVFLIGGVSAFAQTRRKAAKPAPGKEATAVNQTKTNPKKCDGGWSGTITYSKTQNDSEHRKTPTGYQSSSSSFKATAEVAVNEDGSAKASVKVRVSSNLEDVKEGSECCMISLAGCTRNGSFKYADIIKTDSSAEASASVKGVKISGETFTADIGVPEAIGKTLRTIRTIRKRECDKLNQDASHDQEAAASYLVGPIQISGTIDPNNPNVIRGTKTDGDVTITYNLARCAAPDIKLADLALEHHIFPDAKAWHAINSETIDGNLVRIKAKVRNDGTAQGYASVKFTETSENIELPGSASISLQPGEEREVEYEWDTSGFAWTNDKKPKSARKIKAEIENDSLTEDIKIIPKPVILVHGLWSNAAAWSNYQSYLNEAHTFAWKAFPVGADPAHGLMNTGNSFGNNQPTNSIFENARELGKQIEHAQKSMNAWHVDVVAHSMGGLISRFYIHHLMKDSFDGKPVVTHLAMLGTPNMGSPWADIMFEEYKEKGYHVEALRELKTDVCRIFNSQVTNRKGVKFSITYTDKIPLTGNTAEAGDGVVSKSSAIWQIDDVSHSGSLDHTSLTGKEDFMQFIYPRLAVGPSGNHQAEK